MKILIALLLLVGGGLRPAEAHSPRRGGGKIKWEKDYKKALAQARKEGRPMMLYFTADW